MATLRNFEGVQVGNFNGQHGVDRFPPDPNTTRPRPAAWRSNLVALSHHFNLYFAAFVNHIHITIPRDLRQTLPGMPDLILHIPTTTAAAAVGGYMPHAHPHTINHIKIGNLGEFEILLIACDDGDVLAYYTRLLHREIRKLDPGSKETPISTINPFFHENVGKSAWGLAIHQQSRLIAVSTNLWEVTVFQHALAADSKYSTSHGRPRYRRRGSDNSLFAEGIVVAGFKVASTARSFTPTNNMYLPTRTTSEFFNWKMVLSLGSDGDNIPSIDFASDDHGEALFVLATDINANLWFLNLSTREVVVSPPPEASQNYSYENEEDTLRGWGVMCIPLSCFKLASAPHSAIGVDLRSSIEFLNTKFLDISGTDLDVDASLYHPSSSMHSGYIYVQPTARVLESDDGRDRTNYAADIVLDILEDPKASYLWVKPARLPFLSETNWREKLIAMVRDGRYKHDLPFREWMRETCLYPNIWPRPQLFKGEVECFRFLCNLPLPLRYRIESWDALEVAAAESERSASVQSALKAVRTANTSLTPHLASSNRFSYPKQPNINSYVIMRTTHRDLEILPQHRDGISTICQGFAFQEIEDEHIRHTLNQIDRLNMFALIPELSLLIVASQNGRAAVFTLTKLDDDFCKLGLVVTSRLEMILPLAWNEQEWRPNEPLMGMAVAPLQGSGGRIWRLVLHYMDHSVLSYELKRRDDGDELLIL